MPDIAITLLLQLMSLTHALVVKSTALKVSNLKVADHTNVAKYLNPSLAVLNAKRRREKRCLLEKVSCQKRPLPRDSRDLRDSRESPDSRKSTRLQQYTRDSRDLRDSRAPLLKRPLS